MVTRPTFREKLVRDNVIAPFLQLSVVVVIIPLFAAKRKHGLKYTRTQKKSGKRAGCNVPKCKQS